jgi:hypothetical protein
MIGTHAIGELSPQKNSVDVSFIFIFIFVFMYIIIYIYIYIYIYTHTHIYIYLFTFIIYYLSRESKMHITCVTLQVHA